MYAHTSGTATHMETDILCKILTLFPGHVACHIDDTFGSPGAYVNLQGKHAVIYSMPVLTFHQWIATFHQCDKRGQPLLAISCHWFSNLFVRLQWTQQGPNVPYWIERVWFCPKKTGLRPIMWLKFVRQTILRMLIRRLFSSGYICDGTRCEAGPNGGWPRSRNPVSLRASSLAGDYEVETCEYILLTDD